jgi:hypothetical protein
MEEMLSVRSETGLYNEDYHVTGLPFVEFDKNDRPDLSSERPSQKHRTINVKHQDILADWTSVEA